MVLAPSGAKARAEANLAAVAVLGDLDRDGRSATAAEREVLARWSSWGAIPEVFDQTRTGWAAQVREQLRAAAGESGYAAARRTTINAHYTAPAYAAAVWEALAQLGFEAGQVLEPGCGSGVFIAAAPATAVVTGIELDPISAAITAARFPEALVRAESFADTRLPQGRFDAVVGNVPFADVVLHDPVHNQGRHVMHNHFILKSLALTRPGGLVAVLTSRFTLDAVSTAARTQMADLADLLGAVRLPTGAHRRSAGTEAVTDLLVLRRREPDRDRRNQDWVDTVRLGLPGADERGEPVNRYLADHPHHVLGRMRIDAGMHGAATLQVTSPDLDTVTDQLREALTGIVSDARAEALTYTPGVAPALELVAPGTVWDGHLTATGAGSFTVTLAGSSQPVPVPATQRRELSALVGLRDAARAVLDREASTVTDEADLDRCRGHLARSYRDYLARYGPINRFSVTTSARTDPRTGRAVTTRSVPPVMRIFRTDPSAALVFALEHFDAATQTATPADILSRRVVVPRAPLTHAETAADALALCLDQHAHVDVDVVAGLLDITCDQARAALAGLVYDDPATGELVPAARYLSGDVRSKLDTARAAAATDPRYMAHVSALQAVLPTDLGMEEIQARLGAAWIDAPTHQDFLREVLADPTVAVESAGSGIWEVRGATYTVAATSQWGTSRLPAPAIVKAVLEQRPVQVHDEIAAADGAARRVLNPVETAAAQDRAEALQERFTEWIWEDPDRAGRLLREYNRRFNSLVLRDYTTDGQHLSLPGLAATFTPRPHQRTAVARMIAEPAVGLFHQVGAGKTAEMVMGAMELRRLGLVTKPCVVVPNHMLEQFSREWMQLYPQARLLAASATDLAGDRRRTFLARAATNDWDGVVMTRGAFERIPTSLEAQKQYVEAELTALREVLEAAKGQARLTVKRLERMILAGEEHLKARLGGAKDDGITFEATGIDYLIIDEAHEYKNLRTASNIPGAGIDGSKRASDLHLKLSWLRGHHGGRVATFATATPIANSITEAHVMARYLRPDLLQAAGVEHFDTWAATFARTVTEIEMAPTGGGTYRQATRFARFTNVPEMLRLWHVFADVKTAADLDLPTPALHRRPDGQRLPETVIVPASPELADHIADLGERAERVRARAVEPSQDNMLAIVTAGRLAALDLRLVGQPRPSGVTKLDVVADHIARIWNQYRDQPYIDPHTTQPSPVPGALQLVFCDLGTPTGTGWNAYQELRDQLTHRGLPPHQIRFIHDAANDADKARLFADARAGQVAVLIGSTAKMGVGTNVQARAVALHHLDCPWRPADVEQRDGRIRRQGNQNPEIRILRYATEASFDVYSWQTVERKARFIDQVMTGRLDTREIDDIGENTLSFAEVKALASGDPLLLDKATADAERTRLERLARAHDRAQATLRSMIATTRGRIDAIDDALPAAAAAASRTRDTRGEAFTITIHTDPPRQTRSRTDACTLLNQVVGSRLTAAGTQIHHPDGVSLGHIADLAGHTVHARYQPPSWATDRLALFHFTFGPGIPDTTSVTLPADTIGKGAVRRLENVARDMITGCPERLRGDRERLATELVHAESRVGQPFARATELARARATSARIDALAAARLEPQATTCPVADICISTDRDAIVLAAEDRTLTQPRHGRLHPAAAAAPSRPATTGQAWSVT